MALTALTPVFFSSNSTSSGTQATWLGASILRSSLVFPGASLDDSLAPDNPMRSNFPPRICTSASPTLKRAKRRLDEPLLMTRTKRMDSDSGSNGCAISFAANVRRNPQKLRLVGGVAAGTVGSNDECDH